MDPVGTGDIVRYNSLFCVSSKVAGAQRTCWIRVLYGLGWFVGCFDLRYERVELDFPPKPRHLTADTATRIGTTRKNYPKRNHETEDNASRRRSVCGLVRSRESPLGCSSSSSSSSSCKWNWLFSRLCCWKTNNDSIVPVVFHIEKWQLPRQLPFLRAIVYFP